jgi:peptidyl-prolyl cis-trans isomerase A (cyclophilin A)/peptidyl-prolyl cis-trans isomerase B (cyclophilin B)
VRNSRRHFVSFLLACSMAGVGASALAVTAASVPAAPPKVLLKTSMGNIVLELNPELAPVSVQNFLAYVKSGYYKNTIFHRVIGNFMIQGGGFDKNLVEKTGKRPPIKNEAANGLKNATYTIAMARTSDPHSATAQFFINVKDNEFLDYPGRDGWGYAVFGKVVEGMEVVDQIKEVEIAEKGMFQHLPVKPVTLYTATLVK